MAAMEDCAYAACSLALDTRMRDFFRLRHRKRYPRQAHLAQCCSHRRQQQRNAPHVPAELHVATAPEQTVL